MKSIPNKVFLLLFILCLLAALPLGVLSVKNRLVPEDTVISAEAPSPEAPDAGADPAPPETPETPETPEAPAVRSFTDVGLSYFDDALMIGDSRTVGLQEYGSLGGMQFFASTGMSVYNAQSTTVTMPDLGAVTLEALLTQRSYGKIYIMLGVNELGYDFRTTVDKYTALVEQVRRWQPDAILFLEANLHLAKNRSESDPYFNNANINRFNAEVEKLADQKELFYINVNPVFDDAEGNLRADYTSDDTHIYGKYYQEWTAWLMTKGIA